MTLIKGNITNGSSDSVELRKKIIEAEKAEKEKENQSIKDTVDNLADSIEDFTDKIQEFFDFHKSESKKEKPREVYYDKNLSTSIDKAVGLLQKLKQPTPEIKIDVSPIANEIKKGQDIIVGLLNRPNQSEEVVRMLSAMIGKQNIAFERLAKGTDYSPKLDSLIEAINNNKTNDRVEEIKVIYDHGYISKAIPIYKTK